MSVSEVQPPASAERQRTVYSEATLEAKAEVERAGAACDDARLRWLRLEVEVRAFDEEHHDNGLSHDQTMLQQRAHLRGLLSEARVAKDRADERLRDAGARHRKLAAADEYRFRHGQLAAMYAERDEADRVRAEAFRRRRFLFRRLRR